MSITFGKDPEFDDLDFDFDEIVKSVKQDAEDRRCLRGKYAPPAGVCRVCSGKVVAEISFPDSERLGGPPRHGYISGWHCEGCFIVYWRCPP